ncbi:MAG: hypothetical protein WA688_04380 [Thermoplasmata archaeon]
MRLTRGREFHWLLVALLVALVLSVGGAGRPTTSPLGLHSSVQVPVPAACQAILAQDPAASSTLFLAVCGEPTFAQALEERGVANFTLGTAYTSEGTQYQYGFYWTGSCPVYALALAFGPCSYQEWWVGNVSTGNVSGPFLHEGPTICAG